jgi:hypothetical protein
MTAAAGSRTTVTLMDFNARFRLDRRVGFSCIFRVIVRKMVRKKFVIFV